MTDRWWGLCVIFLVLGCGGPAKTGVDLQRQAIAFNDAGYQYYRQSRFNLAQGKFEKALEYNRLIDRRSGIASNLNNLGVIAQAQGDPEAAVGRFQEALAVNRELHDPAAICETLNNLGLAYQGQGRLKEAEAAYLEALDQARQLPPGPLLALTLTHLGDVARAHKDYMLALNYYQQAVVADTAAKDRRGQALRRERLGRTFLDLKDYGRAASVSPGGPGGIPPPPGYRRHRRRPQGYDPAGPGPGRPAGGGTQRPTPPGHLPGPGPGAGN